MLLLSYYLKLIGDASKSRRLLTIYFVRYATNALPNNFRLRVHGLIILFCCCCLFNFVLNDQLVYLEETDAWRRVEDFLALSDQANWHQREDEIPNLGLGGSITDNDHKHWGGLFDPSPER